jgi:hypothetical protein
MYDIIDAILSIIGYFATLFGIIFGVSKLVDIHCARVRQRDARHKELLDKLNTIERAMQPPTKRD